MDNFCGPSSNFTLWSPNPYGTCYEKLLLFSTHFIFAMLSCFHAGRKWIKSPNLKFSITLHFRLIISIIAGVVPLVLILIQKLDLSYELYPDDFLSAICQAFAWASHSLYLWRLRQASVSHLRGHNTVLLSWFLALVSVVINLTTTIRQIEHGGVNWTQADSLMAITTAALYIFYMLTLIPSPRHTRHHYELMAYPSINDDCDDRKSLLGSNDADDVIQLGFADDGANVFSKAVFWWIEPLMKKGAKGQLRKAEDLFHLPKSMIPKNVEQEFNKMYLAHQDTLKNPTDSAEWKVGPGVEGNSVDNSFETSIKPGPERLTLLRALNKAYGLWFYGLGIPIFFVNTLKFAGPLLLNALVLFVESGNEEPMINGYYYAISLALITLITAVTDTHIHNQMCRLRITIRSALVTTIYRKSLAVSSTNMSTFSTGEIVNFMSTDSERVLNYVWVFHAFWCIPMEICIALFMLYQQIGLAFLAGVAFALILIPINRWFVVKIVSFHEDLMKRKDSRIKIMNEVLNGIRVIKFYAWEKHFTNKIHHLRGREMESLSGIKYIEAGIVYLYTSTPVLICIFTFSTYVLLGHQLTAAKVFTSIALFYMLIGPLQGIPWCINCMLEAWVSIKRLQAFMELKELNLQQYYAQEPNSSKLAIQHGKFYWEKTKKPEDDDDDDSTGADINGETTEKTLQGTSDKEDTQEKGTLKLTNVNLQISKGQLVGVIGKVGSGKSSLLAAITSEMTKECGTISVTDLHNGFGLSTQESWIQHATLRDNVLFGEEFDAAKYEKVLEACALKDDIKILPAGDQTEVGENGITLSGGQKARLSLARAVYQDKDIYLLDGPLAAVDAHVGAHIFSQCIMGVLRNKTRILCTHHTKYLWQADLVVVMENGTITAAGTPSEILTRPYTKEHLENEPEKDNTDNSDTKNEEEITTEKEDVDNRAAKIKSSNGKLVAEEEHDVGAVKFHVYQAYWKAIGKILAPCVLLAFFFMQASENIVDCWLTYWVTHIHSEESNNNTANLLNYAPAVSTITMAIPTVITPTLLNNTSTDNTVYWLGIYGGLVAANSIFTIIRAFLSAYTGLHVAKKVHNNLLGSVLNAPISFFDSTPIGRIINRFSSDVCTVDGGLPEQVNNVLQQVYQGIGTIVIICYGLPWFALFLIPVSIIYYFIQNYYRKTSRELRRISRSSMSPIYSHFSETLSGAMTIRALKATTRFEDENRRRLDANMRARFSDVMGGTWLNFRLQLLGVAIVSAVGIIAILEHQYHTVNPAFVGLAISYALSMTGILNNFVQSVTNLEQDMVSMERTQEYTNDIAQEEKQALLQTPHHWPSAGCISFQDVFFAYRPDLPNALDGVTFDTKPTEKLGIVGRTGSGKSSLFLVMFRMVDIQKGAVIIDGIDACHMGLTDYRSRLAIIPQDPFLFSGTVRENLDPSGRFSDAELWAVLDKCHLRETVSKLGGLEAEAAEKGRHFSAGQRQLVCLGRAMLTKAKVLCIDEATASVDMETDSLIQETIREEFADSTVLTIAHRINTIMDSDRIIFMDKGRVVELDTPDNLLKDPSSKFSGLVSSHGLSAGQSEGLQSKCHL